MSAVDVAVVIPTQPGRETRLAFALEALAEQTLDGDRYEVIVVGSGSPDEVEPEGEIPVRTRILAHPAGTGPGAKRNHGWRSTTAPLIAFTDDDCRAAPDWLERLIEAHGSRAGAVIQGRTEPDPDEAHLLHGLARSRLVTGESDWYEASNIAYPRTLLAGLDGFDEGFYFGGEDTDLGLRARSLGAPRLFANDAVVWHAVLPRSPQRAIRDAGAWESMPLLIRRHPKQRRAIFARIFMRESHAYVLLAAGGMATLPGPLRLLAAAPWFWHRLDRGNVRPRGLLRQALHMPVRALVDLAETTATVRAAVRHRVFVL